MKKIVLLPLFAALSSGVLTAEDTDATKETITLRSDQISAETFTETEAGNGLFYSDIGHIGFLATGKTPYTITEKNNTQPNKEGIDLSYNATVSVGTFMGESHLIIGTEDSPLQVYTRNSLFVGGYGWFKDTPWRNNATLESNIRGSMEFAPHEGSITINKGSTLEVGTELGKSYKVLGGAQLYIGHASNASVTVDGGNLISHAFIGISTDIGNENTTNDGLLDIKNGGKVIIKAEPEKMAGSIGYSYNQLMIGHSTRGTGKVVISGEESTLELESSANSDSMGQGYYTYASIGQGAGCKGEVLVENGGNLTLGTTAGSIVQITIGEGSNATGTLTVDNATANLNGYTYIGYGGHGTIDINNAAEVTQSNGVLVVGLTAGGKGEVNVNDGTLTASGIDIGSSSAQGSLNVAADGIVRVSGNLSIWDTADDGNSNSITNAGTITTGGYINLTDGTTMTNTGHIEATGDIWVQEGSTLNNSGSFTSKSELHVSQGSTINNTGTLKGNIVNLEAGSDINNEGELNGQISGSGTIHGSGEIGAVSVGKDTTLVVGAVDAAPILGLTANEITLEKGSYTLFNIDGLTNVTEGGSAAWGSGEHSIIYGDKVQVQTGANFELVFNQNLFAPDTGILTLDLLLIDGGSTPLECDVDELMDNTIFTLNNTTMALRRSMEDEWVIDTSNLSYTITENQLKLTGNAQLKLLPEPTTTTLSLLALAALAVRRRRN